MLNMVLELRINEPNELYDCYCGVCHVCVVDALPSFWFSIFLMCDCNVSKRVNGGRQQKMRYGVPPPLRNEQTKKRTRED